MDRLGRGGEVEVIGKGAVRFNLLMNEYNEKFNLVISPEVERVVVLTRSK